MGIDWNEMASTIGYEGEGQMLDDMYNAQHLSIQEIAERLGFGKATIRRRLGLYEIERRTRGGANNPSNKRLLLHLLDQRFVRQATINEVARVINAHPSTVWKYLRGEKE